MEMLGFTDWAVKELLQFIKVEYIDVRLGLAVVCGGWNGAVLYFALKLLLESCEMCTYNTTEGK